MDPKKLECVKSWPTPKNPTNIRQFLGLTGFYQYFVPKYSEIARWDQANNVPSTN
jgi:hypothetical protein